MTLVVRLYKLIIFIIRDLLPFFERDSVTIYTRDGHVDSDLLPFIIYIYGGVEFKSIYLVSDDSDLTASALLFVEDKDLSRINIIPRSHAYEAILRSWLVVIKDGNSDAKGLNHSFRKRTVLHIDHGLITKKVNSQVKASPSKFSILKPTRKQRFPRVVQSKSHAYQVVATQAKCASDKVFVCGYPRFYRSVQILNGSELMVDNDFISELKRSNKKKVLWAPTGGSGMVPKFLDLDKFDAQDFRLSFDRSINFYAWLHPKCKRFIVDEACEKMVVEIDRKVAPNSLEFISIFDLLITDCSSIMMDAFSMGVPVVHVLPEDYKEGEYLIYEEDVSLPGDICKDYASLKERLMKLMLDDIYSSRDKVLHYKLNPNKSMENVYGQLFLDISPKQYRHKIKV